jgi:hypothetical protein
MSLLHPNPAAVFKCMSSLQEGHKLMAVFVMRKESFALASCCTTTYLAPVLAAQETRQLRQTSLLCVQAEQHEWPTQGNIPADTA